MSNVVYIHGDDQEHLLELHDTFKNKRTRTGCSVAAASFLILGALIVIGCASLCLTLPGVNVINNVILPGVLPGSGALLLSIPFVIDGVRKSKELNKARDELVDFNIALFSYHKINEMEAEDKVEFIKEKFFNPKWTKEYAFKLIGDIKKRYPKKDPLAEALDEVRTKISKNK